jgi:hypothetical protein
LRHGIKQHPSARQWQDAIRSEMYRRGQSNPQIGIREQHNADIRLPPESFVQHIVDIQIVGKPSVQVRLELRPSSKEPYPIGPGTAAEKEGGYSGTDRRLTSCVQREQRCENSHLMRPNLRYQRIKTQRGIHSRIRSWVPSLNTCHAQVLARECYRQWEMSHWKVAFNRETRSHSNEDSSRLIQLTGALGRSYLLVHFESQPSSRDYIKPWLSIIYLTFLQSSL